MKKIGPIIMAVVVAGGLYWLYTRYLGGSVSGPTKGLPTKAPDVNLPDAGDAANTGAKGAQDGANWLSDFLANMTPTTWKIVGVAIVASFVYWLWKEPKRRALALLLIVIALIAVIVA